jgi:hypothetical protein
VLVSDFRFPGGTSGSNLEEIRVQSGMGLRTGLIQLSCYEIEVNRHLHPAISQLAGVLLGHRRLGMNLVWKFHIDTTRKYDGQDRAKMAYCSASTAMAYAIHHHRPPPAPLARAQPDGECLAVHAR